MSGNPIQLLTSPSYLHYTYYTIPYHTRGYIYPIDRVLCYLTGIRRCPRRNRNHRECPSFPTTKHHAPPPRAARQRPTDPIPGILLRSYGTPPDRCKDIVAIVIPSGIRLDLGIRVAFKYATGAHNQRIRGITDTSSSPKLPADNGIQSAPPHFP